MCATAVRQAFFVLFRDGLIYRGKRLVNWDPVTRTALADDEVEMKEVDGHMWYLRYPLARRLAATSPSPPPAPRRCSATPRWRVNPRDPRAGGLRRRDGAPADRRSRHPDRRRRLRGHGRSRQRRRQGPARDRASSRSPRPTIRTTGRSACATTCPSSTSWAPTPPSPTSAAGSDVTRAPTRRGRSSASAARTPASAIVDWFDANGLLEEVRDYTHSVGHSLPQPRADRAVAVRPVVRAVTDDRLRGAALRALDPEQAPPAARRRARARRPHRRR